MIWKAQLNKHVSWAPIISTFFSSFRIHYFEKTFKNAGFHRVGGKVVMGFRFTAHDLFFLASMNH